MRYWIKLATTAILSCFAAIGTASAQGSAQDYPNHIITIVVPLPAGGPTDQLARQLAPKLQAKFGQNVVIENVSGGATNIGIGRVARSAPDGYTLLLHSPQVAINHALYPKLNFDSEKDLVPIIFINYNPVVLIGRKSLPADTFAELVTWMKSNTARIATPGSGTHGHLATVQMLNALGISADLIPYRGAAPAMQDILGEHVDLYFAAPQSLVQVLELKSLKAYGQTMRGRSALLPQVPSLVDLVGPQMEIPYWSALLARTGTPQPIIDKLNAAVQEAMKDPTILKTWADMGVIPYAPEQRTPQAGMEMFRTAIKRAGEVIRANKIEVPM
jgi:tripartite-type tricarboxylate transporter receptor subunit TctC